MLMTSKFPKRQLLLLGGDVIFIIVSFYFAPVIRFGVFVTPGAIFGFSDVLAVFFYLLGLYIFNFYNLDEAVDSITYFFRFAAVILAVNLIYASFFYIFHLRSYSSSIIAISGLMVFVLLLVWRLVIMHYIYSTIKPLRVIILGAGWAGRTINDALGAKREYEVVGFVDDDVKKKGTIINTVPVLGASSLLSDIVHQMKIDKIIVAVTHSIKQDVFKELVTARFNGVAVYPMPTFYEKITGKIPVLHTNQMWLGFAEISGLKKNIYNIRLKKVFDKGLSLFGILVSFPIVVITALLIKLESPGPVLYRQKRVGWDEKEFDLIKFRSMRQDAEANGAVWAQENDPRVTRVGRIIRKLRIDELPQLWNVLNGDMSFVGPRPERPEFVKILKEEIPYYSLRHSMRSGITGWAQVNYRYGASKEDALEKLQYDLYYIKNMSMFLDFYILLRTVRVMIFGTGAR